MTARIPGEPPAFRGKPRFCEKNTVKRRKEKNDERKQGNGKLWDWETALRLLNAQTHYPPGCGHYNAFVDTSWKDAHI